MSTVESMSTTERFLQYVAFDTQSVRESTTAPSAEKELALAAFLVDELKALGVEDARIGEGGVVYGSIPATPGCEANPAIGFIAHMDTSPDAPGANARPQIVRYDGGDVTLNVEKNIVFSVGQFPDILKYKGQDVIFTDGTTLLGADDKAGIAEIMQMVAWIKTHPEVPHARLCIGFTPDEEVARGTENFDIPLFGAAYAYTFDGGEIGTLESENFNAGTALVTIRGVGVHPGLSKGKMVNSVRYAARLIDRLPIDQAPETTEGHEGFLHPNMAKGTVVESVVRILVRDHDRALYEEKKAFLVKLVDEMSAEFPRGKVLPRDQGQLREHEALSRQGPEGARDCARGLSRLRHGAAGGADPRRHRRRAPLRARVALPERVHGRHELSRRL